MLRVPLHKHPVHTVTSKRSKGEIKRIIEGESVSRWRKMLSGFIGKTHYYGQSLCMLLR
jgi:hypothetical protein